MSFLSKLIGKKFTQTAGEYNKIIYNWIGNGSVFYNPENDDAFIRDGYQHNNTVYAIIQMITKNASCIPFNVYEVKNKSKAATYKAMTSGILTPESIVNARQIKAQGFEEVHDTDLHELLRRPNPAEGYASFMTNLIAFGKLTGNRYIYGLAPETGDNAGKFKELYVLPSQHMEVISGGLMQPIKAYRLNYNVNQEIEPDYVCHIKDFNPNYDVSGSHLYGQSPLMAAFRTLAINNEAVNTSKKMLENQSTRGVLVSKENNGLNQLQAKQLDQALKAKMAENRGGIAITGQPLEWINFGLSPADLQVLDQIQATSKMLCQAYGVPSGLLGIGEATYENQKEWKKSLYQNAIIPELNKIRDELNRWLVPTYGENLYLDFDYSAIPELQEDIEKQTNSLAVAWWKTGNEKRIAQGYAPLNDPLMDEPLLDAGKMPISDLNLGDINLDA